MSGRKRDRGRSMEGVRRYLSALNIPLLIAMILVTAFAGSAGFRWDPPAAPANVLLERVGLLLDTDPPLVGEIKVSSHLEVQGQKSRLTVIIVVPPALVESGYSWRLITSAANFTGHLCDDQSSAPATIKPIMVDEGNIQLDGAITKEHASSLKENAIILAICWDHAGPALVDSGFLYAQLPGISFGFGDSRLSGSLALQRSLSVGLDATVSDETVYTIQAGDAPDDAAGSAWNWLDRQGGLDSYSYKFVHAIDQEVMHKRESDSFRSGIAFGLAGAGAVAVLEIAIMPLNVFWTRPKRPAPLTSRRRSRGIRRL